jgi:selenocysteine-specific elongation factor
MDEEQEAAAGRMLALLREAGVSPPSVGALAEQQGVPKAEVASLLRALADRGQVVPVGEDLYAHPEAETRARDLLVAWLREKGQIGVVDYRDQLGASRKYVYAWLDHFDALGITYRVENLRYLREGAVRENS